MQITKNRIKEKSKAPKNMSGGLNGMHCLSGLIVLFKNLPPKCKKETNNQRASETQRKNGKNINSYGLHGECWMMHITMCVTCNH